jgi:hypothetical protein
MFLGVFGGSSPRKNGLRSADGGEYSKGNIPRLWPAKGSWSGILTTPPIKLTLSK